jgi:hypothetical protein
MLRNRWKLYFLYTTYLLAIIFILTHVTLEKQFVRKAWLKELLGKLTKLTCWWLTLDSNLDP